MKARNVLYFSLQITLNVMDRFSLQWKGQNTCQQMYLVPVVLSFVQRETCHPNKKYRRKGVDDSLYYLTVWAGHCFTATTLGLDIDPGGYILPGFKSGEGMIYLIILSGKMQLN